MSDDSGRQHATNSENHDGRYHRIVQPLLLGTKVVEDTHASLLRKSDVLVVVWSLCHGRKSSDIGIPGLVGLWTSFLLAVRGCFSEVQAHYYFESSAWRYEKFRIPHLLEMARRGGGRVIVVVGRAASCVGGNLVRWASRVLEAVRGRPEDEPNVLPIEMWSVPAPIRTKPARDCPKSAQVRPTPARFGRTRADSGPKSGEASPEVSVERSG